MSSTAITLPAGSTNVEIINMINSLSQQISIANIAMLQTITNLQNTVLAQIAAIQTIAEQALTTASNIALNGEYNSTDASTLSVPSIPSIPLAGGSLTVNGFITAIDTATGNVAIWTVTLSVWRAPNNVTCEPAINTTAAPLNPGNTGTLSNLAAPTLVANSSSGSINTVGLVGKSILWKYNLTYGLIVI